MINKKRNSKGSVMAEVAFVYPIFLFLLFCFIEFSRALYVQSTLAAAAQQVAGEIAMKARRTPVYNTASFSSFADRVRYPGSVVNSSQFTFNVVDVGNNTTVDQNGFADGVSSTKVIVTVTFPPQNRPNLRIPIFDPGRLIGQPVFGRNGLTLRGQAVRFLERSRRPTV